MEFNPRMSMARQTAGGGGKSSTSRPQDDSDAFMTLPDREIAGCISDIGIPFTVADLQKPNPQTVQKVFEWFAELLLNSTRDVVNPAMSAAAHDLSPEETADRVYPPDTRDLLGFFTVLRGLLLECGVADFSLNDLYKPTHPRLVKMFSYLINFIRFRESQTSVIDEHFNRAEGTKVRIEQLYAANGTAEDQLAELQRRKASTDQTLKDREARSAELKQRLLDLKRGQERVADRLERAREESASAKKVLEDTTTTAMGLKQDVAKLKPYTQQSPAALEGQLKELSETLARDRAALEGLDRRARALQTSMDSFVGVHADVVGVTRLVGELGQDLAREEEELGRAMKRRDALTERSGNVREVERQERLLKKQLENITARTEKMRSVGETRQEEARRKMEELRDVHKRLAEERGERGREMERRRVRIEQTEKKMADLKENIENEIHAAHAEYVKMESHIKLYITEMEQSIAA